MKKPLITALLSAIALCVSYGQSEVTMTSTKLYNGKLEILLPDSFQLMATESLVQFNPDQGWPNLVYMNKTRNISIELMYTNQPMSADAIPFFKDVLKEAYGAKYPSAVWKGDGVEMINDKQVGYFECVTKSDGGTDIFNMFFVTEVDNKLFSGSILFPLDFFEHWISLGKEVMRSIKVVQ
jgi:hypothetical protein